MDSPSPRAGGARGAETAVRPGARAGNQQFALAPGLRTSGSARRSAESRARATGRAHDLSATAPYATGAKHAPTDGGKACVVGRTCVYAPSVGWMERLGLAPRVTDMPHEVTGEGQDDVGTKTADGRSRTGRGKGPHGLTPGNGTRKRPTRRGCKWLRRPKPKKHGESTRKRPKTGNAVHKRVRSGH